MLGLNLTDKAIAYLETNTPKWLKVCIAIFILAWMTPLEVRDWFYDKIDTRVHAVITPMKKERDAEITAIKVSIDNLEEKTTETNVFVRELALKGLGAKRFEEVTLTMDTKK